MGDSLCQGGKGKRIILNPERIVTKQLDFYCTGHIGKGRENAWVILIILKSEATSF